MKQVGRSTPPIGLDAALRGDTRFVTDVPLAEPLHMRIVRSPVAFGRLNKVDVAEARAHEGVREVWTCADLRGLPPIPIRATPISTLSPYCQPLLANSTVRYVGEPVAVIFAETAAQAEDASETIDIDIDAFEPQLDFSGDRLPLTEDLRSGEAATVRKGFGDLNTVFHLASHIVEERITLARDMAMPFDLRGAAAQWDPGSRALDLWAATRAPAWWRATIAEFTGLSSGSIRLHQPARGGDFGMGMDLAAEDVLVALGAMRLRRAVVWREEQREHFMASPSGRGFEACARGAADRNGALIGLDVEFWLDQGAYMRPDGIMTAELIAALAPGQYALEAYRSVGHMRVTHKTPRGQMRGAGAVEATMIVERLMDKLAATLDERPDVVRRRSLLPPFEEPLPRNLTVLGTATRLDSGAYESLLDKMERHFSLDIVRRRVRDRRLRGELIGFGLSVFTDAASAGPGETVALKLDSTGILEVSTSAVFPTLSHATSIVQVVSDILGLDTAAVRITEQGRGDAGGSYLAAGTTIVGAAAQQAAEELREQILARAGQAMNLSPDRLTIQSGRIREADKHFGGTLSVADLARGLREGGEPPLSAAGKVACDRLSFPYGATAAVVSIDRASGLTKPSQLFVAADVGNAINPDLIRAQLVSGAMMGLSSALYTSLRHSKLGDPQHASLADYAAPTLLDSPPVEVLVLDDAPSPNTPLGAKGAGRLGVIGVAPAVAAAVDAALGKPGFVTELPVSPVAVRTHLRKRSASSDKSDDAASTGPRGVDPRGAAREHRAGV